jgi:hypothetical protein
MKKALFFTEQQVELPPSYNSHAKNKNKPHLAPFSPRDKANMQTNSSLVKKGKRALVFVERAFCFGWKSNKGLLHICQFAPDVDTENTAGK